MRSDYLRLLDIRDAISEIQKYLPADRSEFDRNPPLQSHIYRQLTIIGEASYKLSPALKAQHAAIPWHRIEGMRHIMVHDYFKVNWTVVFETARDHAPVLKPQIEAIVASLPPDPSLFQS